ncbi:zinc transporter, ZIP family [Shimia gijangensis]|uniref:Zinc transporter, ZIP family n=2 Tax=Shimia gijangensis TaxID=1470563 RepID=A0A1M6FLD5_9RHOB|nr:zinc transporter, ZIP family [Shimia gijangensis]
MHFPDDLMAALVLATLAGLSVPAGAALTFAEKWVPHGADQSLRHFVTAFGGGALISAIALVLVPEGVERLPPFWAVAWFGLGGLAFLIVDRALAKTGSHAAQFLAMLLDYLPEAMALGALLAADRAVAVLMAVLIGLQNLPEGFNAFREMRESGMPQRRAIWLFLLMVPVGPAAAALGMLVLADSPGVLGAVMMFSSGGILYLLFQDVAPAVPMKHSWLPPFGAVAGFMLGLAGHLATG